MSVNPVHQMAMCSNEASATDPIGVDTNEFSGKDPTNVNSSGVGLKTVPDEVASEVSAEGLTDVATSASKVEDITSAATGVNIGEDQKSLNTSATRVQGSTDADSSEVTVKDSISAEIIENIKKEQISVNTSAIGVTDPTGVDISGKVTRFWVTNNLDIKKRLQRRVNHIDTVADQSAKLWYLNCRVVLKCLRGTQKSRTVKLSDLDGCSNNFVRLVNLKVQQFETDDFSVLIDMSSEVLDLLLNYFTTNLAIVAPAGIAVQLFAGANLFKAILIVEQLRTIFVNHIEDLLRDPMFLNSSDSFRDVVYLESVFSHLTLNYATFYKLIKRVQQWAHSDKENNSVVALGLIATITSSQIPPPRPQLTVIPSRKRKPESSSTYGYYPDYEEENCDHILAQT